MGCKMEVVLNSDGYSTWTVNLSERLSNIFYQSSLLFSKYLQPVYCFVLKIIFKFMYMIESFFLSLLFYSIQ